MTAARRFFLRAAADTNEKRNHETDFAGMYASRTEEQSADAEQQFAVGRIRPAGTGRERLHLIYSQTQFRHVFEDLGLIKIGGLLRTGQFTRLHKRIGKLCGILAGRLGQCRQPCGRPAFIAARRVSEQALLLCAVRTSFAV